MNDYGMHIRQILRHSLNPRCVCVCVCNSQVGTAASEYALNYLGRRYTHANVFMRLEQRLREKGSLTPTALLTTGHPRTPAIRRHNYRRGKSAAEKLTRYCTRIGTTPTEGGRSASRLSTASIPPLAERTSVFRRSSSASAILGMATTPTGSG
jgi:hypothetical protein